VNVRVSMYAAKLEENADIDLSPDSARI